MSIRRLSFSSAFPESIALAAIPKPLCIFEAFPPTTIAAAALIRVISRFGPFSPLRI